MKLLLLFFVTLDLFAALQEINIIDKDTFLPITGALVSNQRYQVKSDSNGKVSIEPTGKVLFVKAYGYKQKDIGPNIKTVLLEPFVSKALYVSFWAAGSSKYMNRIFELVETTEINTVVVDVKNEFGSLSYKTDVPLAIKIGAHRERTIDNIDTFIKKLKEHGLYVIARVVVFKDDKLARANDEFALKDSNGTVWRNKEKLAWVDPFETKVHDYVAEIAADAASHGFDEINFDYVRFPLREGLSYQKELNQTNRVRAISDFLKTANKKLLPYNIYTSVDTYGYVCWNKNDTNIGHTIKSLSDNADYIAPMLYPSGFGVGILGYTDPTDHPFEIINESINEGLCRANVLPARFRPWLQSFKDYGFDRKFFRSKEVSEQIKGAEQASCSGWMLWNSASRFTSAGLQDTVLPYPELPKYKEGVKQTYCFRKEQRRFIP